MKGYISRRIMFFALGGILAAGMFAQSGRVFTYQKATDLSSAAEVVTIHLPTASQRTVSFVGASVYCEVACTFTIERNGTAPTTTAGVASADWLGSAAVASAVPYHTSNVGSPAVGKTYNVSAGQEFTIDLANAALLAGQNLTIRTSSITGDVRIFFQWRES